MGLGSVYSVLEKQFIVFVLIPLYIIKILESLVKDVLLLHMAQKLNFSSLRIEFVNISMHLGDTYI